MAYPPSTYFCWNFSSKPPTHSQLIGKSSNLRRKDSPTTGIELVTQRTTSLYATTELIVVDIVVIVVVLLVTQVVTKWRSGI